MSKRRANGEGNIYKHKNGTWVGRYCYQGNRHAVYGKTQGEVRKKLKEILAKIDAEDYVEESDMRMEEWLDTWRHDYIGNVKKGTAMGYETICRLYIVPEIGKIELSDLRPPAIQKLYNKMVRKGLSPKTVKNVHGILHKSLDVALKIGYISRNPTEACILPRVEHTEIQPLDTPDIGKLLQAAEGKQYGPLIKTALFTGMRSGELLGLTWDCVDFDHGLIIVKRQLIPPRKRGDPTVWGPVKNDKPRTIAPAPFVMDVLKEQKNQQHSQMLNAGDSWNPGKFPDLVFTHPDGSHLSQPTAWKEFQKLLECAGLGHYRFHDLRHSFAVASLQAGDDMKTLQLNLGHHSAAFTMQQYCHVTETMQRNSPSRMQKYIENLNFKSRTE